MHKFLPAITIITPVKNSVKTLEKAILSLVSQNYPNLEYIIIDGKSTDGTLEIIKKNQKYIDYWISEEDQSSADAYIKGIKKASNDIIAFLNADDFYEKDTLLKVGEEFRKDHTLEMVSFGSRLLKFKNNNYEIEQEISYKKMSIGKNQPLSIINPNARFFKKDLFYKYGFPLKKDDQNRPFISNDLEYMLRFALNGVKNKNIDHIGYNYLCHENSLTFNNNLLSQQRLMEDKIFVAKKFLNEQDQLPISKFWQKSFKKWIKKYRAKLIKSNLKLKKYNEAKKQLLIGLKENDKVGFSYFLLKTLLRK